MPFIVAALLTLLATAASAQDNRDACARDVQRYCRSQINDGDMVVLSCLQQNRARLTRACAKVLTDNGR